MTRLRWNKCLSRAPLSQFRPNAPHPKARATSPGGFTLPELLALVSTLALLALLLLPLAADNASASAAMRCLNNKRQLTIAWQLYASDHQQKIVHNLHGGDAAGGAGGSSGRLSPWASGWESWGTESDNTNSLFLREPRWARLGPYIATPQNIHKCPSDRFLSFAQLNKGWHERVRSVAMNGTLGHANYPANSGPWNFEVYAIALSLGDLLNPGPAQTSLFLDEHPDSINDPFLFPPLQTWVDLPGNFHMGAGSFSFADGHAELHTWTGKLRTATVPVGSIPNVEGSQDITWMSYHSNRRSEKTY